MGHKEVPVTHLRKMMLEELQRRNFAKTTVQYYLQAVESSRPTSANRRIS
jgi:hypothetical protein